MCVCECICMALCMHVCILYIRNMETRTHTQHILFALVFLMFPNDFIIRILF